jgi:Cu/Ag efflux pump CusA
MLIDTPPAKRSRLGEVADVQILPTPNIIKLREDRHRCAGQRKGRDLASVAQEVQRRLDKISLPFGYRAVLQGEYIELKAAQQHLIFYAVLAVVGIFLLLQLSFQSWRLAILSFLTLPSALVGGVLAAYAAGGVISLGSLVGFLSVLGIAARNGIMMINHFQHLERYENKPFGIDLVLRGARERLTPILMTTGATGVPAIRVMFPCRIADAVASVRIAAPAAAACGDHPP